MSLEYLKVPESKNGLKQKTKPTLLGYVEVTQKPAPRVLNGQT